MKTGVVSFGLLVSSAMAACGGAEEDGPLVDPSVESGPCETDLDCSERDGIFCNGLERCRPEDPAADAYGCVPAAGPPCLAGQRCVEADADCITECDVTEDADGDGHLAAECGGIDCDDGDGQAHPGNAEVCDLEGHDEDCLPETFGFLDEDGDGFASASCCNGEHCGTDCNDAQGGVHPTATEACDEVDNDCDGHVDEGVTDDFYPDADGDGYGDGTGEPIRTCFSPAGYADNPDDCDDARGSVHPAAGERCEVGATVDDDCDGDFNEGCDCEGTGSRPCEVADGACEAGRQSCIDGQWSDCSVAEVSETCNGADDDCDGNVDEGVTVTCYADDDNDGFPAGGAAASLRCPDSTRTAVGSCPASTTGRAPRGEAIDCNDGVPGVRPGAAEECNAVDDDCDGATDEGVSLVCYLDEDGDTYAVTGAPGQRVCPAPGRAFVGGCPVGFTNRPPVDGADCNDRRSEVSPAASEICDEAGVDEDCDGVANPDLLCDCIDGATLRCSELEDGLRLGGVCGAGRSTCIDGRWGPCTILPSPEACNGLNDDCDTDGADEDFACVRGSVAPCEVCGHEGEQVCVNDCSGYGLCRAEEVCNACDDDADGIIDDSFFCAQGRAGVECETTCGTKGTGVCDDTCGGVLEGTCTAPLETCNYCDDDGDGTTSDEEPLAVVDRRTAPHCSDVELHTTGGCGPHESIRQRVHLTSLDASGDVGAAWLNSSQGMGWGTLELRVVVQVQGDGSGRAPTGGWAVVLTQGGDAFVGAEGTLGLPYGRRGLAIEWHFHGESHLSEDPETDVVILRRLTGSGEGEIIRRADVDNEDFHLDSDSTGVILQPLYVRYQPEDAALNFEMIQVSTKAFEREIGMIEGFLRVGSPRAPWGYHPGLTGEELVSGHPMEVGVTAGTRDVPTDIDWVIGDVPVPGSPPSYFEWNNVCY